ncbi:MAG: NDP-sugar synthase [Pyrinomonadaceae bacterium]|nr:NDP-sugar synthase [Pyrinomonadaceae bacterium]
MKTIIIATGAVKNAEIEIESNPRELMTLIDRPFIQHLVENLVEQGIVEFDFILSQHPEKFEKLFGDGQRWGSKFTFHLAREAEKPYKLLKSIVQDDQTFLLVQADRILTTNKLSFSSSIKFQPQIFYWQETIENKKNNRWAGFAVLPMQLLTEISDDFNENELENFLLQNNELIDYLIETEKPLNVLNYRELLESQDLVLNKKTCLTHFNANEVEKGVWISRNVSLPPSVTIIPPVFIGENCGIGFDSEIGPNAVIGSNCLIDKKCLIENSIVTSGSFLGENLTVSNSVVMNNKLVNTNLGIKLTILDNIILGNLFDRDLRQFVSGLFSRLIGLLMLIITFPVLLLTILFLKLKGIDPVLDTKEIVQLPANNDQRKLKTCNLLIFVSDEPINGMIEWGTGDLKEIFLRFLPALFNIAKGEIRMVGVRPRTLEEVGEMSADWQELYLNSKVGLITEAFVHYGANPSPEELCAAECVYSVRAGFIYDLKLTLGFFKRLLQNLLSRETGKALKTSH